jgi:hypothetical protein
MDLYLENVFYVHEYKIINTWSFVFDCKYGPKYYVIFKNKENFFYLYGHSYLFRLNTTHLQELS